MWDSKVGHIAQRGGDSKKKGKQEMANYGKTMPYIKQYILMSKVKQYVEYFDHFIIIGPLYQL